MKWSKDKMVGFSEKRNSNGKSRHRSNQHRSNEPSELTGTVAGSGPVGKVLTSDTSCSRKWRFRQTSLVSIVNPIGAIDFVLINQKSDSKSIELKSLWTRNKYTNIYDWKRASWCRQINYKAPKCQKILHFLHSLYYAIWANQLQFRCDGKSLVKE